MPDTPGFDHLRRVLYGAERTPRPKLTVVEPPPPQLEPTGRLAPFWSALEEIQARHAPAVPRPTFTLIDGGQKG